MRKRLNAKVGLMICNAFSIFDFAGGPPSETLKFSTIYKISSAAQTEGHGFSHICLIRSIPSLFPLMCLVEGL